MQKFNPLSDEFFEELHAHFYSIPYICEQCVKPTCSCGGGSHSRAVLLPGEADWVHKKVGRRLPIYEPDPNLYDFQGDCTYLEGKACIGGQLKPWDCWAYPLCPFFVNGRMYPRFASNCSYPVDVPSDWTVQIWRGWHFVKRNVEPSWLEYYNTIPDFEPKLITIGERLPEIP